MVFKATFNNISVISWRSVLLVEETGVPGENHQTVARHVCFVVPWSTCLSTLTHCPDSKLRLSSYSLTPSAW
jgi:hypothetical protein